MKYEIIEIDKKGFLVNKYPIIFGENKIYKKTLFGKKEIEIVIDRNQGLQTDKNTISFFIQGDKQLTLSNEFDIRKIKDYIQNYKQSVLEMEKTLGSTSSWVKFFEIFILIILLVMMLSVYQMFVSFKNSMEKTYAPIFNISSQNQKTLSLLESQNHYLLNLTNYTLLQNQKLYYLLSYALNVSSLKKV